MFGSERQPVRTEPPNLGAAQAQGPPRASKMRFLLVFLSVFTSFYGSKGPGGPQEPGELIWPQVADKNCDSAPILFFPALFRTRKSAPEAPGSPRKLPEAPGSPWQPPAGPRSLPKAPGGISKKSGFWVPGAISGPGALGPPNPPLEIGLHCQSYVASRLSPAPTQNEYTHVNCASRTPAAQRV